MTSPFVHSRLDQLLVERGAVRGRLDKECAALLDQLREKCPGAVAPPPAEPGALAEPVAVSARELGVLLRAALADEDADEVLVLADGDSELLIDPPRCRVATGAGVVVVVLGVECDQTDRAEVAVPFAVGGETVTAGMIMATEGAPRGPEVVTGRWCEALVALAWEALVSVAAGLARHVGTDLDVAPLLPGALEADEDGITLVAQARHQADRLVRR